MTFTKPITVVSLQQTIVSPHVFFGKNRTFRDARGLERKVETFEDAKAILFAMYSKLLKDKKISSEKIEKAIKCSPNGQYAYFSLKLS